MSRTAAIRGLHRDDGVTLVEIIVYIAVATLFLTLLATVFFTSWQADAATRDRDAATDATHIITSSVQTSVRNASGFRVDGSLLRARVSRGASDWECRAWRLANPRTIDGQTWYELQYNHGNAAIDDSSTGWKPLLDGLNADPNGSFLVRGGSTPDKPFGGYGNLLTLNLKIRLVDLANRTLDGEALSVKGEVVAQAAGGETPTCW